MEQVLWNSIDKKQNGLKYRKITNHTPSPEDVSYSSITVHKMYNNNNIP